MEIGTGPSTWHPDTPTEDGYYWVTGMEGGSWGKSHIAERYNGEWYLTGIESEQDTRRWYFSDRIPPPLTPNQRTPEEKAEFMRIVDELMEKNAELYRRLASGNE